MTKKEKTALDYLETLLLAPQQEDQLPISRKLVSALNTSRRLRFGKTLSGLDEAMAEFERHPLGPGQTAPKYLDCECSGSTLQEHGLCTVCGRKAKKVRVAA